MKFTFTRPPEGEIGLEDAITQALIAAEGEEHPSLLAIREALMLEILAQQKRINEKHEAEISTWKQRLVDETARLRTSLEDKRERLRGMLANYWPDENPDQADIVLIATLDKHIAKLFEEGAKHHDDWIKADSELDRLHDYIVDHFPKFGDRPPVDGAIEILTIVSVHGPAMVKVIWEQAIRPAIQAFQKAGIDILPPGTIVYGAQPKPHRPE